VMKIFTLLIILCLVSVVGADDFKTIKGKEYKNVTVSRVEPDGIVLSTSSGISKVYFTELPKEVQERFHYDAEKGDEYSRKQNEEQEQLRKQQEEALPQKHEATEKKNNAAGDELAARESAKNQEKTVQALQTRLNDLQKEDDDLVRRIEEAEQLPQYLTGQSGRKHYSYLNPAWKYIPEWRRLLNDVRQQKDELKQRIEQAQR
jgi:chromosome segregation ATPase